MKFFREIDVLIIFEHISRELETCFYMKLELEKLELSCELAPLHFNRYVTNIRFKPRIVVLPFLNSKDDFTLQKIRDIYGEDVIALNLHHEQLYNESTKKFMLPKDSYSRETYHLAWTESFYSDLIVAGAKPEKIKVLCNPRFDSFWLDSGERFSLSESYEEVIFFPTTFAWAFVSEDYFLSLGHISKDRFYRMKEITDKAAQAYFNDIKKLADSFPEKLFLVRPHPYEDINYFHNKFLEYSGLAVLPENIKIERCGNVYDWIKIASVVIGWCTTTNMEAAMCKKCSVVYHPTYYPADMNLSFFKDFDIVNKYEELVDIVSGLKRKLLPDDTLSKFSKLYGFPLSPVCPNIARWIRDTLLTHNNSDEQFNGKNYLVNIIYVIFKDIPKYLLIKLKLMHIFNKNYSGLYEDCVTYGWINKKYKQFKNKNG
ncbi:hypothetical protein KHZ70_06910 [Escherichia coli]|uniref:hypothetical protein n=1 Tax=Escherichia coli TaxID=562 RepID=UPI001BCF6210|nr:hypothetical protein [Escherichia coli]QVK42591.1 hypothetical protein KHZ70_06910 [Escherichia coli]